MQTNEWLVFVPLTCVACGKRSGEWFPRLFGPMPDRARPSCGGPGCGDAWPGNNLFDAANPANHEHGKLDAPMLPTWLLLGRAAKRQLKRQKDTYPAQTRTCLERVHYVCSFKKTPTRVPGSHSL